MSPNEVRAKTDRELVEMLTNLRPSDEALAWLAALLAEPAAAQCVGELTRRYHAAAGPLQPCAGRYVGAMTVGIDPARWSAFWFRRRLPLNAVGPLFNRCEGWASVIKRKAQAGYYALDELATAISMRVDELIFEVGTDEERERLATAF